MSIEKRLTALEKAVSEPGETFVPQVVPYDVSTNLPFVTPDPRAKQIWIGVNDEQEAERVVDAR
jgi:hypothetical protein